VLDGTVPEPVLNCPRVMSRIKLRALERE